MFALLALSATLAAPVPQPAIKIAPIPPADTDATDYDKPPKGALLRLGSRQMRHPTGDLCGFAADGRTLLTTSYNLFLEWDTDASVLRRKVQLSASPVMHPLCTPDGCLLVFSDGNHLQVWDRAEKKRLHTGQHRGRAIGCTAVSPTGKAVAVGTYDGQLRLFDVTAGQWAEFNVSHPIRDPGVDRFGRPLPRPSEPPEITAVAWAADGRAVASAASGEGVRAWDPVSGKELWAIQPPDVCAGPIQFTPDGKHLIATSEPEPGKRVGTLWDVRTRTKAAELTDFTPWLCLVVSPDGRYFSNGAEVWDTSAGKVIRRWPPSRYPHSTAFSRDGKRMAVGDIGDGVRVFDVETGKELFDDTGHAGQVVAVAATPDGKLAATAATDGTARVWDVGTGKMLHTFRGHQQGVASVALSPDGQRLATGDLDAVRVFDLKTGKELWKADGHSQLVQVAFAPDGDTLAVSGGKMDLHLHDAKDGELVRTLVVGDERRPGGWKFAWTEDSAGIVAPTRLTQLVPVGPRRDRVGLGGPGGEGDGKFRFVLWDVKTGDRVRVLGDVLDEGCIPVAVQPGGKHVAYGGGKVRWVELETGRTVWVSEERGWGLLTFCGEDRLYTNGACLDVKTGTKAADGRKEFQEVQAFVVPANGKVVLTARREDNTVVVWPRK